MLRPVPLLFSLAPSALATSLACDDDGDSVVAIADAMVRDSVTRARAYDEILKTHPRDEHAAPQKKH